MPEAEASPLGNKQHDGPAMEVPGKPWAVSAEDVVGQLAVSREHGLDEKEVQRRRKQFGPNRLRETKQRSAWQVLADQFKSVVVGLLVAAAALAFAFHEYIDGAAILAVIAINAAIGFFMEMRALQSMQALRKLSRVMCNVKRKGSVERISAEELVPGDIVVFEGGDIVTADTRVVEASKLEADESMLTGESAAVGKDMETLDPDTELVEQTNMLFKGTALTRGSGEGVVVTTGMDTQLGEISSLIEEAEEEITPLEERLNALGRKLVWVTCVIAALTAVSGILTGKDLLLMVETAVALAVAAIPEGLPIVATIALARGMLHMARRNAIVNRLSAVETLGATNVICTDKTGTLTENKMTVKHYVLVGTEIEAQTGEGDGSAFSDAEEQPVDPAEHGALRAALELGVLCSNATLGEGDAESVGDPMEVALLAVAKRGGIDRGELLENQPEEREEAFDSDIKMMATFNRQDEGLRVCVKGAAEPVLEACTKLRTPDGEESLSGGRRQEWLDRNEQMAERGLRVLALAEKKADDTSAQPYEGLTFVGLVGLLDPPRMDVRDAVEQCRAAGIEVVMVTGDQPATARNIAEAVSVVKEGDSKEVIRGRDLGDPEQMDEAELERLRRTRIFARVSPKQKLSLIAAHQDAGNIVAMTGDGVNDGPALKKADIGVAMGQRGTEVAREASDMVLADDAFSSIVAAVETGRVIFGNIRKFVVYLMSCNLSEILVVGLATVVNAPLPILPLQILFLNVVTDVFPALALGMGEGSPDVMKDPPRAPDEPILARRQWLAVVAFSTFITIAVLGGFALAFVWLKTGTDGAVTIAFLVLALSQLWHVFNMRNHTLGIFVNDVTRNRYVWGALVLCAGLLLMAVYLPGLNDVLDLSDPGPKGWGLAIGLSLLPLVLGQIFGKLFAPRATAPLARAQPDGA